ncbi:mitochondrial import inner membrane translocase subunit tim54 [Tieghemiomyces parasiticus]|uniref:Mitochondrial import inner membrane translocase subunit TIM54 n=1 Tax=Tieghemiomyces parasiticus TaxID=78921 RepID=A0A9W8DQR5_9FUNG|nr:mitochondrial import inner membrane translocase subunit tim54 [Tieghemiomyces parasiticus]
MANFKIPSPKTTAFVAVLSAIVGVKKYDTYRADSIRERIKAEASVKAKEPLDPMALPTKVIVYLTPPPGDGIHKSRIYFRDFVKPIFDAGALDYDVIEAKEAGDIHTAVSQELLERRRDQIPAPPGTNDTASNAETIPPSPVQKIDVRTVPKIAIGRQVLAEIYNGLSEGSTGSLNITPEPVPDLVTEVAAVTDATTEQTTEATDAADLSTETAPVSEPEPFLVDPADATPTTTTNTISPPSEPSVDYDALDTGDLPLLPVVGFINFKNRIGWLSMPGRILGFFNTAPQVEKIGEQALSVVLEARRPFRNPEDLYRGQDDDVAHGLEPKDIVPVVMEPRVMDNLVVFDVPKCPPGSEHV